MPSLDPRHRYRALKDQLRAPETEPERSLYVLLHGAAALNAVVPHRPWQQNQIVDPSVEYPFNIFKYDATRYTLDAFLLSSTDDHLIGEALSMPADEVGVYRHLFFDTAIFKTDLELIVFLQQIPEDNEYKPLYKVAFHQGLGAMQWHFCRNKGQVNPNEVISTLMTDSYYRSLEHRGQSITSKVAKEAAKLARLSLDCARVLNGNDPLDANVDSLKIKFEQTRKNRTITEVTAAHSEILH